MCGFSRQCQTNVQSPCATLHSHQLYMRALAAPHSWHSYFLSLLSILAILVGVLVLLLKISLAKNNGKNATEKKKVLFDPLTLIYMSTSSYFSEAVFWHLK